MESETKLDDSFPTKQFLIKGFTEAYSLDRNSSGGEYLVYVEECIPSKLIAIDFSSREGFSVEINLRKKILFFFFLI